jgi:hypothetical protein
MVHSADISNARFALRQFASRLYHLDLEKDFSFDVPVL